MCVPDTEPSGLGPERELAAELRLRFLAAAAAAEFGFGFESVLMVEFVVVEFVVLLVAVVMVVVTNNNEFTIHRTACDARRKGVRSEPLTRMSRGGGVRGLGGLGGDAVEVEL